MSAHRARKRFGQNFLVSQGIIERIVALVGAGPADTIVEIGPGRGALTAPLAKSGARLIAVEFDRDLIEPLRGLLARHETATVLNQDFLTFDPAAHGLERFVLVGNLPFNLTSPVIEWTCAHAPKIERAVFMMQKEVALRLCSAPGSKDWSPLAIFTQLVFATTRQFDVGPEHFAPRPKVTSSVVALTRKAGEAAEIPAGFERVVRAAFRQRRKLLANNLAPEIVPDAARARRLIAECALAANVRAEQLTTEDFFRLTNRVAADSIE